MRYVLRCTSDVLRSDAMMLSVTDLTSFLHCPKRLYAVKKLGFKEPISAGVALGSAVHRVIERLSQKEVLILADVYHQSSVNDVLARYRREVSSLLSSVLLDLKKEQGGGAQELMTLFNQALAQLNPYLEERAKEVIAFTKRRQIFGKELAVEFSRTHRAEESFSSESLGLKGRIDEVRIDGEVIMPVEFKTGSVPFEHVWEEHKVQLAAYALLLEEYYKKPVEQGVVKYLKDGSRREAYLNPFVKQKVRDLVMQVNFVLGQESSPQEGCGACAVCRNLFKTEASHHKH